MKNYIQVLPLSIISGTKEEAGHLTGEKTVTRSGSRSLAVDRPSFSTSPKKGSRVRSLDLMSIGLKAIGGDTWLTLYSAETKRLLLRSSFDFSLESWNFHEKLPINYVGVWNRKQRLPNSLARNSPGTCSSCARWGLVVSFPCVSCTCILVTNVLLSNDIVPSKKACPELDLFINPLGPEYCLWQWSPTQIFCDTIFAFPSSPPHYSLEGFPNNPILPHMS